MKLKQKQKRKLSVGKAVRKFYQLKGENDYKKRAIFPMLQTFNL